VNLRCRDEAAKSSLLKRIRDDEQFKLDAMDEPAYFERQMSASIAIKWIGRIIAVFLTLARCSQPPTRCTPPWPAEARNRRTSRDRLQPPQHPAFISVESVLLCLLGGLLGCLATLPLNGLSTARPTGPRSAS